ncbi:hypothetical protein CN544_28620 [Bacillus toyonensis]|uniref:hypothetical protein n=1 Tax=Bacillus toyonensis TaxID=155322 RepID=UPI000BF12A67|nr:hypothetical protein [Bacillus toyonensis]PEN76817.1 hypothetical protein CN544_28620 [Bacillus toyonensis]PHD38265.1 hypothetical protein COF48_00460 [Bacillus toyonensis]
MPYVQYKNERGVLHIGEGRFFHAGEPQKVTAKERDELLDAYKDLEEVKEASKSKNLEAGEVNA